MKGIEALLLAAFIALVGVGLWNARQWLPQWSLKTVNSAAVNTGPAVGKSAGKPGDNKQPRGKRGGARNGRSSGILDLVPDGLPVSETRVDVPALLPSFPTRADLPVGASGARIRAKYGEPTARVTEMRGGQLLERYFYFDSDGTQLTVATLESGIIVSAENYRADLRSSARR